MKSSVRGQRLRIRLGTIAVGAVVALLGTFVMAKPAAAATGWDRCPVSMVCIFEHHNGEGRYAYFASGSRNLTWPIGGFNFNDQTSSVWNRQGVMWNACFYYHIDYNSPALMVAGNTPKVNLYGGLNESFSSINRHYGSTLTTIWCSGAQRIT